MVLIERLSLELILANRLAAPGEREDLRRRARVTVPPLIGPDVDAPMRPDRDRLGLAGPADVGEDADVERLAGLGRPGGGSEDEHQDEPQEHGANRSSGAFPRRRFSGGGAWA
jgi:hypothetical protein